MAKKNVLATPLSKSSCEPCRQKPALKQYLVINVSYQWNINSLKKEERRNLRIAYWQLTTQLAIFHGQQEFSEHHETWFSPYIAQ